MKTIFYLALAGIILLAGCNKSGVAPSATNSKDLNANTATTSLNSTNGSAGITNVYYDGNLFMMNINPFTDQPASSLLAHNKSINILYESDGFVTVTNAIQGGGPGYNALWQEVDIVFNAGFKPHQFLSDNDILPAAAGPNPEITLVPTTEVYRCAIVQHTKVQ
ncbi:MAG TPA: hypothetical protein VNW51_10775 [Mucilaginibacter sp.]|jgi:hypothetical protein|nr:hypothetical protein [Mucilaginibacter sp.]